MTPHPAFTTRYKHLQMTRAELGKSIEVKQPYVWRRALDDQVHLGDVQPTGRHVSSHQHFKRAVPEAFERDLSLFLRNVSVQRLCTLNGGKKQC